MDRRKLEKLVIAIAAVFIIVSVFFMFSNRINITPKKTRALPEADSVSDEMVNGLVFEQTFENEINHEYVLGILCVNVIIRSKDTDKKRDAIEIRLTGANYRKKVLQYYKLEHKKVIYQELVGG